IASAADSTASRFSRMLPLLSMIRPIETGTSSRLNSLICWGVPFSKTENALCGRFVNRWPFLSVTVTLSGTRRVSDEKTASPESSLGCCAGGLACCAAAEAMKMAAVARMSDFNRLLRRRIVAGSPESVQGRQPLRLYQFDIDLPVLPVTRLVSRTIAEHILVSQ